MIRIGNIFGMAWGPFGIGLDMVWVGFSNEKAILKNTSSFTQIAFSVGNPCTRLESGSHKRGLAWVCLDWLGHGFGLGFRMETLF